MSVERITRIVGLVWLPVLLIGVHASAQNVVFIATASAQKIGLNDRLEVSYELREVSSVASISNGGFRDFIVLNGPNSSNSTQIYMTGGRTVQSTVFRQTYLLQPRHTGTLSVPAAVVQDGAGHTYQSNTIKVQVVPGSIAPQQPAQQAIPRRQTSIYDPYGAAREEALARQRAARNRSYQAFDPSRDVMLRIVPDKSSVHLGEQVTLSYKLYTRVPVTDADLLSLPSAEGCWMQELEVPRDAEPQREVVNGRPYAVVVVKKSALFPQHAGLVQLDPVVLRATVRVEDDASAPGMAADPAMAVAMSAAMMDPFGEDFGTYYRDVPLELRSAPVTLTVSDVPAARPEGYKGATGNFTISGQLSRSRISTDDIVSYTVRISGRGNIKLFGAPDLKLPAGLQAYDPQVSDSINGVEGELGGIKTVTYTITPSKAGTYTLPGVSFTFFNTSTNSFETLHTAPQEVVVSPGAGLALSEKKKEAGENSLQPNAAQLDAGSSAGSLLGNPWYWVAYGLPLLAVAGVAMARRNRAGKQSAGRRSDQQALRRLAGARSLMQPGNEKAFYEEISGSLWLYLSDRLYIPPSQLSRAAAMQVLGSRRVPTAVTMKLDSVLQDCEMALYAHGTSEGQMQHAYHAAAGVISEIETYLQA